MTDVITDGDEMEEQDLLFNAYFENEMSDEERASFEKRLAEEPGLKQEYSQFTEIMGGVAQLQYIYAPNDFVGQVEDRIRTRSRGRFFGREYQQPRLQLEVVAIIMLIVMATTSLFFSAPADKDIQDLKEEPPVLKATDP